MIGKELSRWGSKAIIRGGGSKVIMARGKAITMGRFFSRTHLK